MILLLYIRITVLSEAWLLHAGTNKINNHIQRLKLRTIIHLYIFTKKKLKTKNKLKSNISSENGVTVSPAP